MLVLFCGADRPGPWVFRRLRRRERFQLFSREKSCNTRPKSRRNAAVGLVSARLRAGEARIRGLRPLRNPPHFLMRAQRQGLVWSIDGASCGAACQKRLPLRRALWAYHSLGLEALRLIHMKCGAISALSLFFHRSSSCGKNRWLYPINRATAEVGIATRRRSDARRISHSAAGCYQDTTQSDETRDS